MSKLTSELVKEVLTEWTPSTKVQELLGLSSMDEALFKKELLALEEKGVVEREGARRGLKFRAVNGKPSVKKDSSSTQDTKPVAAKTEETVKPKAKKSEKKVDVSEIYCEVVYVPKHEYVHEVTNVAITDLLSFLLKGSVDGSRSLAIKRTSRGVTIKTYNDIYMLSEVTYTKENFSKLLKASGISLE